MANWLAAYFAMAFVEFSALSKERRLFCSDYLVLGLACARFDIENQYLALVTILVYMSTVVLYWCDEYFFMCHFC